MTLGECYIEAGRRVYGENSVEQFMKDAGEVAATSCICDHGVNKPVKEGTEESVICYFAAFMKAMLTDPAYAERMYSEAQARVVRIKMNN